MYFHCLLLVSFTVSCLPSQTQSQSGQNKPAHAHLTLVKKKSRCDTSAGNKVSTHPGPLGFVGTPASTLPSTLFRPALISGNLFILNRHRDGRTMLNDSASGDFTSSFCKLYTPPPPPSGQRQLSDTRNSLLLRAQPISCYSHIDSSEDHIISSKTLFI